MSDPRRIYLSPECCADPETGRMWATMPNDDCEEGVPWTEYVRADRVEELTVALDAIEDALSLASTVLLHDPTGIRDRAWAALNYLRGNQP